MTGAKCECAKLQYNIEGNQVKTLNFCPKWGASVVCRGAIISICLHIIIVTGSSQGFITAKVMLIAIGLLASSVFNIYHHPYKYNQYSQERG